MALQKAATLQEVAKSATEDEYADYVLYHSLAVFHRKLKREHAKKLAAIFEELSQTEHSHYEFWKKFSPITSLPKVSPLKVYGIRLIEMILGATFAIKFLQRHEKSTVERYRSIKSCIPEADRPSFERMLKDEEEHEAMLAEQTEGTVLRYMSFVVLGLADAIVEISGIHAGSLGIYNSTKLTGLAGIVAGAAASISMASAAFAQAKQGFQGSAKVSAAITGVSYFLNAVCLAAPYFLTSNAAYAMIASLGIAVLVLVSTSYYNSIISGAHFLRDFAELAGTMFAATIVLLSLGTVIRVYFGMGI